MEVRQKEGLPQTSGVLAGDEPPDRVEINENAYRYLVDVKRGHKTGFYLDQRENRKKIQAYTAGAEVLNLFSFSGGFAVSALKAGAKSVVNVDSSADAVQLAKENVRLNGFAVNEHDFVEADVFSYLRKLRAEQRTFDVIIADPPEAGADSEPDRARRARLQRLEPGRPADSAPRRLSHHFLLFWPHLA